MVGVNVTPGTDRNNCFDLNRGSVLVDVGSEPVHPDCQKLVFYGRELPCLPLQARQPPGPIGSDEQMVVTPGQLNGPVPGRGGQLPEKTWGHQSRPDAIITLRHPSAVIALFSGLSCSPFPGCSPALANAPWSCSTRRTSLRPVTLIGSSPANRSCNCINCRTAE